MTRNRTASADLSLGGEGEKPSPREGVGGDHRASTGSQTAHAHDLHSTAASRARLDFGFGEVLRYRELLFQLLWRDIMGVLQQSVLGLFWRAIQPLFTIGGYTFILIILGRVPEIDGNPYFISLYAAMLPYNLCVGALFDTVNSISANAGIIKKVYFPRLIFPLVAVLNKLLDFVLGLLLLVALLIATGRAPSPMLLLIVPFAAWGLALGFAVGLWLAYLNVLYRDVGFLLPIATQFLFYLSPVLYPLQFVPQPYRAIMELNPLTGIISGSRWALLGTPLDLGAPSLVALFICALLLVGGLAFFRRTERALGDVL